MCWAIISLPGGVFSAAGAGVKTNLLFFTKGRKTSKIWYYDLATVKVGKKTPLTLAHFGFDKDGQVLDDSQLPANLTAEWLEDAANQGKPFPSYARLLRYHGRPEGESRCSWTVDFAARRARARQEMEPFLDEAARIKAAVVDLKEHLKRLKKMKAERSAIEAVETDIREKEKAVRDVEAKASGIDAAVFDLKAVNPNAVTKVDIRTPQEIIRNIEAQGQIVTEALGRLKTLLTEDE
jgi:type I restriction enzyme M protein